MKRSRSTKRWYQGNHLEQEGLKLAFLLILLIPIFYLLYEPTYFNKDDNFAQFTPIFHYAFNQLLDGRFPWMMPGELNIQLAQSPYYAIFSPLLFGSFLVTRFFDLEPYWTVNIWAVCNLTLMNALLIRFSKNLETSSFLKFSFVLSAGIATFASQFSSSWYYTLPYQILLICKICYWYNYLCDENKQGDEFFLLITTYLAAFGGNPQLFAYTYVVEALFLLPFLSFALLKLWFRNILIATLLFAPYIYCYTEFWRHSWRTVLNSHSINILNFLIRAIPIQKQEGGAQPLWALACLVLCLYAPSQWAGSSIKKRVAYSFAAVSIFLLAFASINIGAIFSGFIPGLKAMTAPMKWWFFGGITSVFAVCIYGCYLKRQIQVWLGLGTTILALTYLSMNIGAAAWKWGDVNYSQVNNSIRILSAYADQNSRISQVSNWRSFEPHPDRNLLLNTWLIGNFGDIIFAKGYETIQPNENSHPENIGVLKSGSVTETLLPDVATFQKLGVSGLWVNSLEYDASEFSPTDYEIKYSDIFNFFAKLRRPEKT